MNKLRRVFGLLIMVLGLMPAVHAAPRREITIFAAASLTDVLPQVAEAWAKTDQGGTVTFSFDATSRLALQIEQGAPADLFIAADQEWMDWLAERELIGVKTRTDLLANALVCVVPKGAAYVPEGVAGLKDKRIVHLALAGEQVPAGKYAEAALNHLKIWEAVQSKIVRGNSVRGALAYVAAGEAAAGIVYRTDALAEPQVQIAFTFPEATHPPIIYPGAVVATSGAQESALAFLAFCDSPDAQAIFRKAGFRDPANPAKKPKR